MNTAINVTYETKGVLIRLGIYLLVNKSRVGGSPQIVIHTLICHNYVRLKFHSFEFLIWALLKAAVT